MKAKTLVQPTVQSVESVLSNSADNVSPNASAIVGVTLLGDLEDVLAVLRTAVLLARNLRAPLSLGLPGQNVLPVDFSQPPCATSVSELLESARAQLGVLAAAFAMEFTVIAASFNCAGSITMRVREFSPGASGNLTK
jgi:hypothetical protein